MLFFQHNVRNFTYELNPKQPTVHKYWVNVQVHPNSSTSPGVIIFWWQVIYTD